MPLFRKLLFITFSFVSLFLSAQSFKPYHSYGVVVNAHSVSLLTTQQAANNGYSKAGEDMGGSTFGFDFLAHYDYGALKWLGVGTGLGFSRRGGRGADGYSYDDKRYLSYLNIPVRVQFKPWYYIWFEASVEVLYFLNYKDVGYFSYPGVSGGNGPFNAEGINNMTVSFIPALRFNLFDGFSFNIGYSMGLGDAAAVKVSQPTAMSTTYKNFSVFVGVRYMFNQPEK
ncbi:hypothetical protein Oweho_2592 [Owenweeksia hongkongensis DSM 17368]|uniref:Outer membrane protein beta-barrel domain-containing protein n=1 Tax=Owenweeksia hongkongensis (strain DSM 17368 / CIP 108786 / JCM 12287 / NRRL B-23963 / UST20020801) TaxID=926562 RepID=G8R8G7_OWEHD|nr:hypothetical protein [Owenweeksia hongkongensis]AEV33560.1 hypothetical protein Oweho_2592 [Owenweeksia hongkongensis DSM 17368]